MKKIILILALLTAGQICFASSCETLVCPDNYELTSGFSQFFSRATGQNFLAKRTGESLIKKAIKKNIQSGDAKVRLDSYSKRDLKNGKFKSLEITGKNLDIKGIYISYFNAKTLCKYNYVAHDSNNKYYLKEDIPASFNIEMTEDDINKTMNLSDYKRLINDINSFGSSSKIFHITSTKIKLKDGKMYYVLEYSMPFVKRTRNIVVSADLSANNGELLLSNANFVTDTSTFDIDSFSKILNYINPLDFSVKILENKDAVFNIENVKISENKVNVSGQLTILKDKE